MSAESDRRARSGLLERVLLAATLLASCGHDALQPSDPARAKPARRAALDAGLELSWRDPCLEEAQGAPCAKDKYCIDGLCVFNTCGDGVKADGEECDDGNLAISDGCDADCKAEPMGCGNGVLEEGEECDDGNHIDDDACSNACSENRCGNQRVDVGEECDDGNQIDADECSKQCLVVRCRNGRLDPGEQCDDGNMIDNDGCTNKCKIMICGNGKLEEKEECDDGNAVDTDTCSNACTLNQCGNLRLDPGEQCDGTAHCDPVKCVLTEDKCTPCEQKYCRNYMDTGIDLVAGCRQGDIASYAALDPMLDIKGIPQPAQYSQLCLAVVTCAEVHRCVASGDDGPASCVCGSATPGDCLNLGPAADASCTEEAHHAATTTDHTQTILRLTDFRYPLGWAYFLLQCDYANCKAECLPGTP